MLNGPYLLVLKIILVPEVTSRKVQHRKSGFHGFSFTLRMLRVKSEKSDWLRLRNKLSASEHVQKIEPGQKSRLLVLTKRSAVSGDENGWKFAYCIAKWVWSSLSFAIWETSCRKLNVRLHSRTIMYTTCSRSPEFTRIVFSLYTTTYFSNKNMLELYIVGF